ncbi:hypothetical protein A2397_03805 [Candidatus Amesbacteria bacterium RIFOXYB1_FULL_44_23]|uniref:Uncharacterized protein n=1 Tax=Candidatus Amesbacteria bacterium RIFOXYB1_FULL_44_23 TaxID=1797263 RepID=A0A1F4ZUX0_9BACT|nr:MAG: hypothetical protein A2397_03805 [Candidatus Amesbacteria bacterium RIFOXYB1_FULL_44_23]
MYLAQVSGVTSPSSIFTTAHQLALPSTIVGRSLLFAIAAAGLFFFYQLLVTGLGFMSSAGDEARLAQLQKQLTNAALGLFVVICAFFIMQILQTITGANLI